MFGSFLTYVPERWYIDVVYPTNWQRNVGYLTIWQKVCEFVSKKNTPSLGREAVLHSHISSNLLLSSVHFWLHRMCRSCPVVRPLQHLIFTTTIEVVNLFWNYTKIDLDEKPLLDNYVFDFRWRGTGMGSKFRSDFCYSVNSGPMFRNLMLV